MTDWTTVMLWLFMAQLLMLGVWVYVAKTIGAPPAAFIFMPISHALKLLWAWGLVILAVVLALFAGSALVVWLSSLAMALTGLALVTRATRSYAHMLIERGADKFRKRYGRA